MRQFSIFIVLLLPARLHALEPLITLSTGTSAVENKALEAKVQAALKSCPEQAIEVE